MMKWRWVATIHVSTRTQLPALQAALASVTVYRGRLKEDQRAVTGAAGRQVEARHVASSERPDEYWARNWTQRETACSI